METVDSIEKLNFLALVILKIFKQCLGPLKKKLMSKELDLITNL